MSAALPASVMRSRPRSAAIVAALVAIAASPAGRGGERRPAISVERAPSATAPASASDVDPSEAAASGPTVESRRWGDLEVVVTALDWTTSVQIVGPPGLLLDLDDRWAEIGFHDVTGDGVDELQIVLQNGGSCCSGVEHWFERTRRGDSEQVDPLFVLDRGRGEGFVAARDLDGRGRPELLFRTTHWVGDAIATPHERLERVVVVGWDGQRYRDRTAAFPAASRALGQEYLAMLDDDPVAAVAGYYTSALVLGDGPRALRRIAALRRRDELRDELLAGRIDYRALRATFAESPLTEP